MFGEIFWAIVVISLILGALFPTMGGPILAFWVIVLVGWAAMNERSTSAVHESVPTHSPPMVAAQQQLHEGPTLFGQGIDWLQTHWSVILFGVVVFLLLRTTYLVFRKRALIRAVAICLPLEMTRCEPLEPRERFEATEAIFRRFGITGQVEVNLARAGALNINNNDPGAFFEGAEYVAEHRRAEDRSFVVRRLIVRWLFDSFAALAGDLKSVDVAWSKAIQAMEYWHKESQRNPRDQINISRLPNLAKAMNLPCDLGDPRFKARLNKANRGSFPRGAISFWLATHLFDYKQYLRYGLVVTGDDGRQRWMEFQGRNAFEVMRMYQAWQGIRLDEWLRNQ